MFFQKILAFEMKQVFIVAAICFCTSGYSQVKVVVSKTENKVDVSIQGKPFTSFIFPDTLEKPTLYPIYAADGELITRGYPIAPRAGESTDHPHHIGLWLNYENVNGLDFWNNSFNIPAAEKHRYGWIRTDKIVETNSGAKGSLTYTANWQNQQQHVLLKEQTHFIFSTVKEVRIIDRITTLTAQEAVKFPDTKDGFLGLRVAHELQLPSAETTTFTDDKGHITTVLADTVPTGNYLTSEGKQADSAWGTRAKWCLLYGKKGKDVLSVAIIDHPNNPGYPTYWHARGYGLFAANTLGEKIFSKGTQQLNFSLQNGASVTFRYRVVISAGKQALNKAALDKLTTDFETVLE